MNQQPLLAPVTDADAPAASKPVIQAVAKAWGFAPNLMRTFANSPAVLEGAWGLLGAFGKTRFSPAEQQLIALTISVENECTYCSAAHTLLGKGAGLSADTLAAARANQPVPDARQEALRNFTVAVVKYRGAVPVPQVEAFLSAGYDREAALEVVLGVAAKTLMNYTDRLVHVPLDDAFRPVAWQPSMKRAA
jgi:AhpD family alkylhydroperoxidase